MKVKMMCKSKYYKLSRKSLCKSINIDKVNLDISEINKKEKTLRRKKAGEDYVGGGDRGLHASGIAGVSGNFWGSGISGVSSREIGCAEASSELCTAASGECCFLIKNASGHTVCPKSC